MRSRYRIALGNKFMDTIDDGIFILDVKYSPIEKQVRESTSANLDGYDIVNTYYGRRTVTVVFELHIYDTAKRNEVCQKINGWAAQGGTFKSTDRSGQYLTVALDQFADIDSVKEWTKPLTLVFVTTSIPWWKSNTTKKLTITKSGNLVMDGNIGFALVSVTATAKKNLTSFKATVGSTNITLKNLNVPAGKKIVIDYLRERYIRIRANGATVMHRLDPSSTDNLQAPCNNTTACSVSSDGGVSAVFEARGMWI